MHSDVRRTLPTRIDVCDVHGAARRVVDWARGGQSRSVVLANVHVLMEAHDDARYGELIDSSDLVVADGMPLVWGLRLAGERNASQVRGASLFRKICAEAEREAIPVGFYGATEATLLRVRTELARRYPRLKIACTVAPPFRTLSAAEETAYREEIRKSGARILFVGLGCPKQESWISRQRGELGAVMLGVGGALDWMAGNVPEAPRWMRGWGIEWLFRLAVEPRRLWRRYLKHNPRFLALAARGAIKIRKRS